MYLAYGKGRLCVYISDISDFKYYFSFIRIESQIALGDCTEQYVFRRLRLLLAIIIF